MDFKRLISFLKELEANNNTQWMAAHRAEYVALREDFIPFIQKLIDGIAVYDKSLEGLEAKDCIYRINRNLRFSPDKRPYKNYFSAYMVKGGRKSCRSGYYLHVQPGETGLWGGIHAPTPEMLQAIRSEIAYNGDKLIEILDNKELRAAFGKMSGQQLKTTPKGYPADHQYIELLRFKDFGFGHPYTDKDLYVANDKLIEDMISNFQLLVVPAQFFNVALSDLGI